MSTYRQCAISVMDNISDPDITFDADGVSNYYHEYNLEAGKSIIGGKDGEHKFNSIVSELKAKGKGKKYDCILGVSGGVDSTYLAYLAHEAGLRVLCVHFDNGWNSELAVHNIRSIVQRCGYDLHTYVIDWPEFKDVQLAYFKAHVIDIEAVTDIAIFSALNKICATYGIRDIIDGRNVATEITLPPSWYCKDPSNLLHIHEKHGTRKLKAYPLDGPIRRRTNARFSPTHSWPLLNFVDYNKEKAKEIITENLSWRDYGGKHYESVFTRFYQGHILPTKFKVDKRKAHLSNLIFSGQISKQQALDELEHPIYPERLFQQDYDFVIKKLGMSKSEFEAYLLTPAVPHSAYRMNQTIYDEFRFLRILKPLIRRL
jgi:N-acetyl sugar amidotransferase